MGDAIILIVVHAGLVVLLIRALVHAYRVRHSEGITLTVTRGDKSMNFLFAFYGVATVVITLLTQVAEAACGYKAVIVAADYLILTYLCFFNVWFRNRLLSLYSQIQKD